MWAVENPGMTAWVKVARGLLLLFFGRELFLVFVGVFGFLAGLQIDMLTAVVLFALGALAQVRLLERPGQAAPRPLER
jgi:hypothetical protein